MNTDQHKIFENYNLIIEAGRRPFPDGSSVRVQGHSDKWNDKIGVVIKYNKYRMGSSYTVQFPDGKTKNFTAGQLEHTNQSVINANKERISLRDQKMENSFRKIFFDSTHPLFEDAQNFGKTIIRGNYNGVALKYFLPCPKVPEWGVCRPNHFYKNASLDMESILKIFDNLKYLLVFEKDSVFYYFGADSNYINIDKFLSPSKGNKLSIYNIGIPCVYFHGDSGHSITDKHAILSTVKKFLSAVEDIIKINLKSGQNNIALDKGRSSGSIWLDNNLKLHNEEGPAIILRSIISGYASDITVYAKSGVIGRDDGPAFEEKEHNQINLLYMKEGSKAAVNGVKSALIHNYGVMHLTLADEDTRILSCPLETLKFIAYIIKKYEFSDGKIDDITSKCRSVNDRINTTDLYRRIAFLTAQNQEDPDIANLFDL